MYLSSFRIENIKAFADTTIAFPADAEGSRAGWNVILGENGSGKSTLLQAMALALVGPTVGSEHLRLAERELWVRRGTGHGTLTANIAATQWDRAPGRRVRLTPYTARIFVTGNRKSKVGALTLSANTVMLDPSTTDQMERGPYSTGNGWFSVGYGPFRRLEGSSTKDPKSLTEGMVQRHASLFRESVALTSCEPWLQSLYIASIDAKQNTKEQVKLARLHLASVGDLLESVLPGGVRLTEVTSEVVTFVDAAGVDVKLTQLSDGYRSFLSLIIDLLRQVMEANQWGNVSGPRGNAHVDTEGVVFIDEADAHLHPAWQKRLGEDLCRVFPKIQFIVSSHSPFVAQAARPNGLFLLKRRNGEIKVECPEISVEGWKAEQILLSPLFGLTSTRDIDTDKLMQERVDLLGLNPRTVAQEARLVEVSSQLRALLTAPGGTLAELDVDARMEAYLRARVQMP